MPAIPLSLSGRPLVRLSQAGLLFGVELATPPAPPAIPANALILRDGTPLILRDGTPLLLRAA